MKTQLSVWRWVLRSTQLCSALLVPSLHRSLRSNCSWNISPFYFYRRWVFGFFFVSMAPTAKLILPKLVPCATLLRDLCVCMCVELPIFEEGQIWECRRFFKIAFPLSLSQISECRWEAVLKWLILSSVHVCLCVRACVGGKLEGMFVWTPQTVYKRFTWPLWHYPVVLNSGFWSFNVSPLADDMLGFLKPEVTVVVSEMIDLSSTPYSLL